MIPAITPPTITAHLVGARYRPPALAILEVLPAGYSLTVRPEPHNEYDPNALAIFVNLKALGEAALASLSEKVPGYGKTMEEILLQEEHQLGYISASEAATIRAIGNVPPGGTPGELLFDPNGFPRVRFSLPRREPS